ncbi:MAG: hypothetical protein ACI86S_001558, partial [Paracoccaceae bacterium]
SFLIPKGARPVDPRNMFAVVQQASLMAPPQFWRMVARTVLNGDAGLITAAQSGIEMAYRLARFR